MIAYILLVGLTFVNAVSGISGCDFTAMSGTGFNVDFFNYPSSSTVDPNVAMSTYRNYGKLGNLLGIPSVAYATFPSDNAYGFPIVTTNFAMSITGYYYATLTGVYNFILVPLHPDSVLGFILGSSGTPCCGGIADFVSGTAPNVATSSTGPKFLTYTLTAGVYYPFQIIYVNTQGAAGFAIQLVVQNQGTSSPLANNVFQISEPSSCLTSLTTYWTGTTTETYTATNTGTRTNLVKLPYATSTSYWAETYIGSSTVTPVSGGQPTVVIEVPFARSTTSWTNLYTTSTTIVPNDGGRPTVVVQTPIVPTLTSTWSESYTTLVGVIGSDGISTPVVKVPSSTRVSSFSTQELSWSLGNAFSDSSISNMLPTSVPSLEPSLGYNLTMFLWPSVYSSVHLAGSSSGAVFDVSLESEFDSASTLESPSSSWQSLTMQSSTASTQSAMFFLESFESPVPIGGAATSVEAGFSTESMTSDSPTSATIEDLPSSIASATEPSPTCLVKPVKEQGFDVQFFNYPLLASLLGSLQTMIGTYDAYGALGKITGLTSASTVVFDSLQDSVYGYEITPSNFAMSMTGYFVPWSTGTYYFTLSTRTSFNIAGFVFLGQESCGESLAEALEGVDPVLGSGEEQKRKRQVQAVYELTEGSYYPIQFIFINFKGSAGFKFYVSGPDDNEVDHEVASHIIQFVDLAEKESNMATSLMASLSSAVTLFEESNLLSVTEDLISRSEVATLVTGTSSVSSDDSLVTATLILTSPTTSPVAFCHSVFVTGEGFNVQIYNYPFLTALDYNPVNAISTYDSYGALGLLKELEVSSQTSADFELGSVYGYEITTANFSMSLTGFFLAGQTGTYTFAISVVDASNSAALLFAGTDTCSTTIIEALSGVNPLIVTPAQQKRKRGRSEFVYASYELTAGMYYPMQFIFVKSQGSEGFSFLVSGPGDNGINHDAASYIYQLVEIPEDARSVSESPTVTYASSIPSVVGEDYGSVLDSALSVSSDPSPTLEPASVAFSETTQYSSASSETPVAVASCLPLTKTGDGFRVQFYNYPLLEELSYNYNPGNAFQSYDKYDALGQVSGVGMCSQDLFDPDVGTVYGYEITPANFSMSLTGFFLAQHSGVYSFAISVRDSFNVAGFIFQAKSACGVDVVGSLGDVDPIVVTIGQQKRKRDLGRFQSYSYELAAGVYYPLQFIFINSQGSAGVNLFVTSPNDDTGYTDAANYIVQLTDRDVSVSSSTNAESSLASSVTNFASDSSLVSVLETSTVSSDSWLTSVPSADVSSLVESFSSSEMPDASETTFASVLPLDPELLQSSEQSYTSPMPSSLEMSVSLEEFPTLATHNLSLILELARTQELSLSLEFSYSSDFYFSSEPSQGPWLSPAPTLIPSSELSIALSLFMSSEVSYESDSSVIAEPSQASGLSHTSELSVSSETLESLELSFIPGATHTIELSLDSELISSSEVPALSSGSSSTSDLRTFSGTGSASILTSASVQPLVTKLIYGSESSQFSETYFTTELLSYARSSSASDEPSTPEYSLVSATSLSSDPYQLMPVSEPSFISTSTSSGASTPFSSELSQVSQLFVSMALKMSSSTSQSSGISLTISSTNTVSSCPTAHMVAEGFVVQFYSFPLLNLKGIDRLRAIISYSAYGALGQVRGVKEASLALFDPSLNSIYGYAITTTNFSMSMAGYFVPWKTGTYTFSVALPDSSNVAAFKFSGQEACGSSVASAVSGVDPYIVSATQQRKKRVIVPLGLTFLLTAGTYYPIELDFVNPLGSAGLSFLVSGPGDSGIGHEVASYIYQESTPLESSTSLVESLSGSQSSSGTSTESDSIFASSAKSVPATSDLTLSVASISEALSSSAVTDLSLEYVSAVPSSGFTSVSESSDLARSSDPLSVSSRSHLSISPESVFTAETVLPVSEIKITFSSAGGSSADSSSAWISMTTDSTFASLERPLAASDLLISPSKTILSREVSVSSSASVFSTISTAVWSTSVSSMDVSLELSLGTAQTQAMKFSSASLAYSLSSRILIASPPYGNFSSAQPKPAVVTSSFNLLLSATAEVSPSVTLTEQLSVDFSNSVSSIKKEKSTIAANLASAFSGSVLHLVTETRTIATTSVNALGQTVFITSTLTTTYCLNSETGFTKSTSTASEFKSTPSTVSTPSLSTYQGGSSSQGVMKALALLPLLIVFL